MKVNIIVIILMFFILGGLLIVSNHNLSFANEKELTQFSKLYIGWLDEMYSNSRQITSNVVRLEWLPT